MNQQISDIVSKYHEIASQHGFAIAAVKDSHFYTMGLSKLGLPDIICESSSNKGFNTITKVVNKWLEDGFDDGIIEDLDTESIEVKLVDYGRALGVSGAISISPAFYNAHPDYVSEYGVKLVHLTITDENELQSGCEFVSKLEFQHDEEFYDTSYLSRN